MGGTRNSNLEFYRVLLMLAIVAHHYVVNSGLMPILQDEPLSFKKWFLLFVWYVGKDGHKLFRFDYRILYVQVGNNMAKVLEVSA